VIKRYQVLPPTAPVPAPDGARYRNCHLPQRTIGVGMGAVEISLPRVSDVPPEVSSDGFHSEIVSRYQRRSRTQARLLARLYLEGLASGDFEPVFRALVGETAALSPSSILKLKADSQQEYETWKKRPLRGRHVYLYADGLYLKQAETRTRPRCWSYWVLTSRATRVVGHRAGLSREYDRARCCAHSRHADWWRRRCWRLAMARWGCGRHSTRSFPPRAISGAGTTRFERARQITRTVSAGGPQQAAGTR
jgi:hypothetical protein